MTNKMLPKNQKQALRRLTAISKLISLEKFYDIHITNWGNVTLQGFYNAEVVIWALNHKFLLTGNKTLGYTELDRGKYHITLT